MILHARIAKICIDIAIPTMRYLEKCESWLVEAGVKKVATCKGPWSGNGRCGGRWLVTSSGTWGAGGHLRWVCCCVRVPTWLSSAACRFLLHSCFHEQSRTRQMWSWRYAQITPYYVICDGTRACRQGERDGGIDCNHSKVSPQCIVAARHPKLVFLLLGNILLKVLEPRWCVKMSFSWLFLKLGLW